MAKKCCVPGCKANYFSKKRKKKEKEGGNKENCAPNVSVYQFPADLNEKLRWIAVIPRVTQERVLGSGDMQPPLAGQFQEHNSKPEKSSTGTTVNFQRGTTQRLAHTSTQPKTNCQVICRREKC